MGVVAKNRRENPIVQMMIDFKKITKKLENAVEKQKSKDEVLNHLIHARNILNYLKELKPSRGEKELLQQYCEACLGVLVSLEDSLKYSYWPAVQSSFMQFKKLHKDMDNDFGPGIWERFKFWFRNLFF